MAWLCIWFGISNTCGGLWPNGQNKIGKLIKNMIRSAPKMASFGQVKVWQRWSGKQRGSWSGELKHQYLIWFRTGAQLEGRGERWVVTSTLPFFGNWKKSALIWRKNILIVVIYVWNFSFKMKFLKISRWINRKFFPLRGLSFFCGKSLFTEMP